MKQTIANIFLTVGGFIEILLKQKIVKFLFIMGGLILFLILFFLFQIIWTLAVQVNPNLLRPRGILPIESVDTLYKTSPHVYTNAYGEDRFFFSCTEEAQCYFIEPRIVPYFYDTYSDEIENPDYLIEQDLAETIAHGLGPRRISNASLDTLLVHCLQEGEEFSCKSTNNPNYIWRPVKILYPGETAPKRLYWP